MTYIIDTGIKDDAAGFAYGRIDRCEALLQGARDSLPADASQSQIDAAVIGMILGELHTPRLLTSVRRALIIYWPIISDLASREPHHFDAILSDYVERTTILPADASENIARRKASGAQPRFSDAGAVPRQPGRYATSQKA